MRALVLAVAACGGVLLNRGGAWIVYHDSVNYRLHDAGFGLLSIAAETAFALGPALWVGGVVLALPLLLGCVRHVTSFRRLVALHVLACLTLVCGLGSIEDLPFLGLLGATVVLWILAMIVAAVSRAETAELDAPPKRLRRIGDLFRWMVNGLEL